VEIPRSNLGALAVNDKPHFGLSNRIRPIVTSRHDQLHTESRITDRPRQCGTGLGYTADGLSKADFVADFLQLQADQTKLSGHGHLLGRMAQARQPATTRQHRRTTGHQ